MGRPDGIVLPFLVALTLAFPSRRYGILFLTGVISIFIRWSFNRNGSLGFLSSEAPRVWGLYVFIAHIAIVGVTAKLLQLALRRGNDRSRITLLIGTFAGTLLLMYCGQIHFESRFTNTMVRAFANQLGLLAPYIALTTMSLRSIDRSRAFGVLTSLSQGWMAGLLLPPIGSVEQWDRFATRSLEAGVLRRRRPTHSIGFQCG